MNDYRTDTRTMAGSRHFARIGHGWIQDYRLTLLYQFLSLITVRVLFCLFTMYKTVLIVIKKTLHKNETVGPTSRSRVRRREVGPAVLRRVQVR